MIRHCKKYFFIAFHSLILLVNISYGQSIVINEKDVDRPIQDDFQYLRVSVKDISFKEAQAAYQEGKFSKINDSAFSDEVNTYWVRFNLVNKTGWDAEWFVEFNKWSYVDFFFKNTNLKNWNKLKTGHLVNSENRAISINDECVIPLNVKNKDTIHCLVKLNKSNQFYKEPNQLGFNIISKNQFLIKQSTNQKWIGLFLGIFLVMVLYNIFVYISLRDINFIWYVAIFLFQTILLLHNFGYLQDIIHGYAPVQGSLDVILSSFLGLSIIAFTNSFLKTNIYLPLWNKILKAIGSILLILPLPSIFWDQVLITYKISSITGLVLFFVIIIITSVSIYKKVPSALYFFIGFLTFTVGLITYLLYMLNLVPDIPITQYSMQLGSSGMAILFAIALGNRLNTLKKENELAQKQIIDQLKENQELQTKVNRELESKVKERTKEIEDKNQELTAMNDQITQHNEEIMTQRDRIVEQNEKLNQAFQDIEQKNQQIFDSIDYAQRIQKVILPDTKDLKEPFNDVFTFYKPRDIVSGDFYWFSKVHNKYILASIDCTGHGIPGAFMSLVGEGFLNQIINLNHVLEPDEILNQLDHHIQEQLKQKETDNRDGMDISICLYEPDKNILKYSGARTSLLYIRNGKLNQIKGNRNPVGGLKIKNDPFTKTEITLQPHDMFYLFSDGFPDQFGGPGGKKFMISNFKNLLFEISHYPCNKQQNILEEKLYEWQGNHPQNDDIMVIGFRI